MTALLIYALLGAVVALLLSLAQGSMRRLGLMGALTVLIASLTLPLSAGAGFRSSDAVDATALGFIPVFPALALLLIVPLAALVLARRNSRVSGLANLLTGLAVLLVLGVWVLGGPRLGKLAPVNGLMEVVTGLVASLLVQLLCWPRKVTRLPGLVAGALLGAVVAGFLLSPGAHATLPNLAGYYKLMRPTTAAEEQALITSFNSKVAEGNAIRKEAGLELIKPLRSIADLAEQGVPQQLAEGGYRAIRPADSRYGAWVLCAMGGLLVAAGALQLRRSEPYEASNWISATALAAIISLLVPSFNATEFSLARLIEGGPKFADFAARSWPPLLARINPQSPASNIYPLQEVLSQMALTVEIALVGTFLAALFAVPLSFLAARNLTARSGFMRALFGVTRTFFNVDRGIDTLILALVFVAGIGLGPLAGVLAMAIHSVADLGKLYSEAIENVERGPIEALESVGATGTGVLRWAILPQVLPLFASYTLYRFEINFRVSIILGFVGAGGIGFFIQGAQQAGNYNQMIIGVLAIVLVVNLIDFLSSEVRRRLV